MRKSWNEPKVVKIMPRIEPHENILKVLGYGSRHELERADWEEIDRKLRVRGVCTEKDRSGHSSLETGFSTLLLEEEIERDRRKAEAIIAKIKRRLVVYDMS